MSVEFKFRDQENWKIHPLSKLLSDKELKSLFISKYAYLKNLDFEKLKPYSYLNLVEYFGKIGLTDPAQKQILPLSLNFDKSMNQSQKSPREAMNEPLLKALRHDKDKVIFDLTGGFLVDSMRLVGAGHKVEAFEQNPILQLLISIELSSFDFGDRFSFHLKTFNWNEFKGDPNKIVFVYDPFFRKKKEKTGPKKEFQFLREFDDQENYLNKPEINGLKIIVKRPNKAPAIWDNPTSTIKGKSIRYDIYQS